MVKWKLPTSTGKEAHRQPQNLVRNDMMSGVRVKNDKAPEIGVRWFLLIVR
jgi:hypothetical protein